MSAAKTQHEASDLLEKLRAIRPRSRAGTCQITMANALPPDLNAVIVAGVCKFSYSDGTDYTDGPIGMNVPSRGSYTFVSDKPNGCVQSFILAAEVEIPNQPAQYGQGGDSCTPDQCIIQETLLLEQQATVSKAKLKETLKFTKRN